MVSFHTNNLNTLFFFVLFIKKKHTLSLFHEMPRRLYRNNNKKSVSRRGKNESRRIEYKKIIEKKSSLPFLILVLNNERRGEDK